MKRSRLNSVIKLNKIIPNFAQFLWTYGVLIIMDTWVSIYTTFTTLFERCTICLAILLMIDTLVMLQYYMAELKVQIMTFTVIYI